jgi:hypothetical protein
MKTLIFSIVLSLVFFIAGEPTFAQEGYTFITTVKGSEICLGTWIPPRAVGLAGTCDGQMIGLPQLTAISTKQSVDRLEQMLGVMSSIDQRLSVNNDQMNRLIEAVTNTQTAIDRQVDQVSEFLRETINRKFDELPKAMLDNDLFRKELAKLKKDILEEVEKRYPSRLAPSKK